MHLKCALWVFYAIIIPIHTVIILLTDATKTDFLPRSVPEKSAIIIIIFYPAPKYDQ